jgi:hypothetical protein
VAVDPPFVPPFVPPAAVEPPFVVMPPAADIPPPLANSPPVVGAPPVVIEPPAAEPPAADDPPDPGAPPVVGLAPPEPPPDAGGLVCEQAIRPTRVESVNSEKRRDVGMFDLVSIMGSVPQITGQFLFCAHSMTHSPKWPPLELPQECPCKEIPSF